MGILFYYFLDLGGLYVRGVPLQGYDGAYPINRATTARLSFKPTAKYYSSPSLGFSVQSVSGAYMGASPDTALRYGTLDKEYP